MAALTGEASSDFVIGSKTTRMSTVLNFRRFVNDRLAAAAREIFGVFEQTVAELEKELERQQEAHAVETVVLRNTPDVLVSKDQIPCGQQDMNFRVDQMKEERPHRREDEPKFPFNILVVKVGDDRGAKFPVVTAHVESEHGPRSSQLHQTQEVLCSSQPLDGEPEPTNNLNGDSPLHTEYSTDDSKDWMDMHLLESNSMGEKRNDPGDKSLTCSGCDRKFTFQERLVEHRKTCSDKILSCSLCGECFSTREDLSTHMSSHTREKPNSCSEPTPCFSSTGSGVTNCSRKKRFCCSECGKWFTQVGVLNRHKRIHTGETPYGCSECGRRFRRKDEMLRHQRNHKERSQNAVHNMQNV